jgi:hypothetical protein
LAKLVTSFFTPVAVKGNVVLMVTRRESMELLMFLGLASLAVLSEIPLPQHTNRMSIRKSLRMSSPDFAKPWFY